MNKQTEEIYENLSNKELITIACSCLEEISNRQELQDYLTEMTYNPVEDIYDMTYDENVFKDIINDFKKYLASKMYKIQQNKEEKR